MNISNANDKISQLVGNSESSTAVLDSANATYEEAQLAVEQLGTMVEPIKDKHKKIKDDRDKTDEDLRSTLVILHTLLYTSSFADKRQSQQRNIQQSLQATTKNIHLIKNDLAAERQRLADANGGVHSKMLDEIEEAKIRAHDARVALEEFDSGKGAIEQKVCQAQDAMQHFKPSVENKRNEITRSEDRLRRMSQDQGDWTRAYHRNLPNLLRAIEREGGFRERPVGPFGRHIRLLKPEWSSILERSLGGILDSFAVTSKHDQTLLASLMKRFE